MSSSSSSSSIKCLQTLQSPPAPTPTSLPSSFHNHEFVSSADEKLFQYSQSLTSNVSSASASASASSAVPASSASPSPVWSCSWSHDGTTLATTHGRPSYPCIRIWKFHPSSNEWDLSATLSHDHDDDDNRSNANASTNGDLPRTIRAVEFAYTPPNVRHILACASFDGTVRIWEDFSLDSNGNKDVTTNSNRNTNTNTHNHTHNRSKYEIEEQEKNRKIQANTNAGWENTAQLEGHENEVKDISWNSTGSLLATCGRDKTIWIWECFLPGTIGSQGDGSTYFNPSMIAGGNGGGGGGGQGDFECISILTSHTGDVKDVEFTSSLMQFGDGDDILLSASYDDTIKVWAEEDGEWYCALTLGHVHTNTIWSIALSSSGVRMISASADYSLGIWKFFTINEKRQLMKENNSGNSKDNEDGKDDMGMYSDGLWKCVGKLPSAHKQPIYTIDCAPSKAGHGRVVSGGGDDSIHIYREEVMNNTNGDDMDASDSPLFTIDASVNRAHDGDVNCVRWHPLDGTLLASVGDDGLVKIWKFTQ
jgi:WD40 repeat protein